MLTAKSSKRYRPFQPPTFTSDIIYAIKAFPIGEATKEQQVRFFNWLIREACKRYDLPWFPGGPEGDRDTSFANGRMFPALEILRAYNMPPDEVAAMREAEIAKQGGRAQQGESDGRE